MKNIFNKKVIIISFCALVLCSINIFASNKAIDNDIKATNSDFIAQDVVKDSSSFNYQSYEDMIKRKYLQDEELPLEERVYSEYNIPFHVFEELSKRVIISMYSTGFSLSDMVKLYEGMGYTKTAGFIKALDNVSTDKINVPVIKSSECYIHNNRYETRSILAFSNGDTATVNIAYNKTIPYLYFADNIDFYTEGLSFDIINKSISMLDDYCVIKGVNVSQYADMDEFIRNFILVLFGIFVMIIMVSIVNNKIIAKNKSKVVQTEDNIAVTNTATNDTSLVAVLTAAIAAYEGTSINGIMIKTIRKNIRWKNI